MGAGLVSGAQAADSAVSPVDGGRSVAVPVEGAAPVPSSSDASPSSGVSPSDASPSGDSSVSSGASSPSSVVLPSGSLDGLSGLATSNPLSSRAGDVPPSSSRQAAGVRAGVVHTVSFSSEAGGAGVPGAQSVPHGGTASWPREDPSRPGWTFNGWFLGDAAYDFSSPVMGDVTLTARWGRWSVSPDRGPWQGGTDVRISDPDDGIGFTQVAAGAGFSVALGSDGNAYTWGDNTAGQLGAGDGAPSYRAAPAMAAMPDGVGFTAVAAGDSHAIALARDGRVWTWGYDFGGSLGRGTTGGTSPRPAPAATPAGVRFAAVSAGFH
ncbi:RCC1 repeat domain protein, partial [Bifidobacterium coryneforme]